MILGLPFTDGVGFDISTHLAKNHESLNGFDFTPNDGTKTVHFIAKDEVVQSQRARRIQSATWVGDYVPIKMDPRAPLDGADPLEDEAPCLTIGQIDPIEEEALISAMKHRANDAIKSYRTDSFTKIRSLATLKHKQNTLQKNTVRFFLQNSLVDRPAK